MAHCFTRVMALLTAAAITIFPVQSTFAQQGNSSTATPIKHLVVIFQENVSFDHYFGTYPTALNPNGEPTFQARPNTPVVNGLSPALLSKNPNLNPANGAGATNPFRLGRSQAVTRDQGHGYKAEQEAFDAGLLDLFPLFVGKPGPPPSTGGITSTTGLNLGYFDQSVSASPCFQAWGKRTDSTKTSISLDGSLWYQNRCDTRVQVEQQRCLQQQIPLCLVSEISS